MATYRVSLKNTGIVNKEEARKMLDSILSKEVTRYKKAGIEAMKEIRMGAVNDWYNSKALNTMNASTEYICESVKQDKDKITITITSYVDASKYEDIKRAKSEDKSSIFRWREKHQKSGWSWGDVVDGKPIPMPMEVSEYLIYLQWHLGIRGLPEEETSTGTGWTNPNYNQKQKIEPMSKCVAYALNKKWEETVNKKAKKG